MKNFECNLFAVGASSDFTGPISVVAAAFEELSDLVTTGSQIEPFANFDEA